jgi:hypothetical protein
MQAAVLLLNRFRWVAEQCAIASFDQLMLPLHQHTLEEHEASNQHGKNTVLT